MADLKEAMDYLETGGLGEVAGMAQIALDAGHPKVQMDSDMAVALCALALEAINKRRAH